MNYILGIDAGATKTKAVIADETGKVLGVVEGKRANLHVSQDKEFIKNVGEVIEKAKKESEVNKFRAAVLGVAGNDTPKDQNRAQMLAAKLLPGVEKSKIRVVNDTVLIRPACSEKKTGISAVIGTGSNFYGVNEKGEEAWVGGLDWRLSDEASAYWVGDRVLRVVVRAGDGRGEATKLSELVLEYFNIKSYRDLANIVYEPGFGKTEVAALAPLADKAYEAGDKVAESILKTAALNAAKAINTIVKRLDIKDKELDIVAVGGQLNSPFPFKEKIMQKVSAQKAEFIVCDKDPVHGAVKLALGML